MELPGREQFRQLALRYFEVPGARLLSALGFTPNRVTLFGFAITVVSAGLVGAGYLLVGGLVFMAGSVLDLMDGALARYTNQATKFGALLDSVMDRLGEAALFLGLAIYAIRELDSSRQMLFLVSLLVALVFSQAVSYARARGESLGIDTRTGLMTRPERVIILSIFVSVGCPEVAFIAIGAISILTLFQRVWHIRNQLGGG